MSGIDEVLERLVTDAAFARELSQNPGGALAGYELSHDDLTLLSTAVSFDRGAVSAVEERTSKSAMFGLLSSFAEGLGGVAGGTGGPTGEEAVGIIDDNKLPDGSAGIVHDGQFDLVTAAGIIDDNKMPGESAGIIDDNKLDGDAAGIIDDNKLPGEAVGIIDDNKLPGESVGIIDDNKLPGEPVGIIDDNKLDGDAAGIIDDNKLPGESVGIIDDNKLDAGVGAIIDDNKLPDGSSRTGQVGQDILIGGTTTFDDTV